MPVSVPDQIQKRVLMKAPLARVWKALTDSTEFGEWFGVTPAGIRPDLIVTGKGLSAGYVPMGACIVATTMLPAWIPSRPAGTATPSRPAIPLASSFRVTSAVGPAPSTMMRRTAGR